MRVVSLVPSLTEALETSAPGILVGATDWCTHPAGLDVERIGGTKNPDVERVAALAPDLVVANDEENRAPDLDALREAGLDVLVTDIRTVDDALTQIAQLLDRVDAPERRWLDAARAAWAAHPADGPVHATAVVPIWRRPWMHVGRDTYAGDVLRRLGVVNALAGHAERYPRVELDDLPAHDLVVLPDEPYRFTADDGPEAFSAPCALVDGRALTWYGPAMVTAPEVLTSALRSAR